MTVETLRTTCSRDCPDACAILAKVEDGKVLELRGDPEHPVTKGFLCFRTSRYPELMDSEQRIRQPLLRRDGQLQPCSWEEAIEAIAAKLTEVRAESGPSAIFHYRSGGSLGILKHLADLFFDLLGPCATKIGDICSGAGEAAQQQDLGTSDSNDLFDLLRSRNIVLWGKNPTVSNVHLVPVLKEAVAGGARLVLIDPVHHKSAALAELVLQPRPGSDFELAMAVARELFDSGRVDPGAKNHCDHLDEFRTLACSRSVAQWAAVADVSEAAVRALANRLADGPTAILVGWGMQRRQRGGAIVRALDALSAISGNLFRSGGGVSFYFKRRKPFRPFGMPVVHPRLIREPLLGQDLLAAVDPPVRVMWVTAGNPVAMLPDSQTVARALEQVEFLVVADCFMTDTARRAHVVLPVPTLLEDSDLLGAYGHHWIGESRGVVPMPAEVRHEVHIFQDLAKRFGLTDFPQDSVDNLKRMALAPVAGQAASLEFLRKHGAVRSPLADKVLFGKGRVVTANGKVQLLDVAPAVAEVSPPAATADASEPLWLFSNSTEKSQASVWSGKGLGERTWVLVHPDAVPGLQAGATVRVESPTGSLQAELRLDPAQRKDVAIMPKGGHYDRGQSANVLIEARATDIGLGAAYLDCLVRIVPC
ncbi:MAG: molybdopterin-dependent oxidoreductase [Planctomycetes bacterium]|nr:molybdopterin-dependent oxidoreductase [Planctomycetota bacterium]MCB9884600.1 molybdopterin-dependent oxidoreductase [Planctomycetota bacterium]